MGAEDFLVRLSFDAEPESTARWLAEMPQVRRDTSAFTLPSEVHYRHEDARHIIELELAWRRGASMSLRFVLCHLPSIDVAFADLVAHLAQRLQAEMRIAEDEPPDDADLGFVFAADQAAAARRAILQCIPKKRRLWQLQFGTVEARASCREAVERFVIAPASRSNGR